jgi:hypothetical protein
VTPAADANPFAQQAAATTQQAPATPAADANPFANIEETPADANPFAQQAADPAVVADTTATDDPFANVKL